MDGLIGRQNGGRVRGRLLRFMLLESALIAGLIVAAILLPTPPLTRPALVGPSEPHHPANSALPAAGVFTVTYTESGLPWGVGWQVDFGGTVKQASTPTTSIVFNATNGSFGYSWAALWDPLFYQAPPNGTVRVAGSDVSLNGTFLLAEVFKITYNEQGLPSGTGWRVSMWLTGGNSTARNENSTYGNTPNLVIGVPNGTWAFSVYAGVAYVPVPGQGTVNVSGNGNGTRVKISFATKYLVQFNESGLGIGRGWTVALNGTSEGLPAPAPLTFYELNGSYNYSIGNVTDYSPDLVQGNVTVHGSAVYVHVVFALDPGYYLVTFNETGLPTWGDGNYVENWSLNLSGGNSSQVNTTFFAAFSFVVMNGTFTYAIWDPDFRYAASPSGGLVVVNGANATVPVTFREVVYSIVFQEGGLPTGTSWSVNISSNRAAGSTASLRLLEPNGTYWAFFATPAKDYWPLAQSHVTVAGTNQTVYVQFAQYFLLTFHEIGLPNGTSWTVDLSGISEVTNGTDLPFLEPNGTYAFQVGKVSGYTASPAGGPLAVQGSAVNVSVTFTTVGSQSATYSVTFVESGLPNGTLWTVIIKGTSANSSSGSMTILLMNGTYPWAAAAYANGTWANDSGNVSVSGSSTTVAVAFRVPTPPLLPLEFQESGVGASSRWTVALTAQEGGLTIQLPVAAATRSAMGGSPIIFRVSPGDYGYVATATGQNASSGTIGVRPATTPAPVRIAFVPAPTSGAPRTGGFSSFGTGYVFVGVAVLAIVAAIGTALLLLRTHRARLQNRATFDAIFRTEWEADSEGQPTPRRPV